MTGPDEPEDEGGFLRGWSKRKLAAKRQTAPRREDAEPEVKAEPETVPAQVEQDDADEEVVAALPPLDDIIDGSDIKPFLAKGVPAKLRNAAMRRLWMATPGVRDYSDPAVDYAWDWNAPGGVPGGGGVLSESGVAKMLKDLIGGRQDPPPEESVAAVPAETDLTAIEAPEQAEVKVEDDVASSPIRRSDTDKSEEALTSTGDETIRVGETSARNLPSPRRHGSAIPS